MNDTILREERFIKGTINRLINGNRNDTYDALKKQMYMKGYTEQDICKKTGIRACCINDYMTGKHFPSKKHLLKLANALEVPVETLQIEVREDERVGENALDIERLRLILKKKGWSQSKLSRESGITEASISKYLNGTRNPAKSTLIRLANALEVDVLELICDAPLGHMRSSVSDIIEQMIIRYREFLTDEEKEKLIRMLMD